MSLVYRFPLDTLLDFAPAGTPTLDTVAGLALLPGIDGWPPNGSAGDNEFGDNGGSYFHVDQPGDLTTSAYLVSPLLGPAVVASLTGEWSLSWHMKRTAADDAAGLGDMVVMATLSGATSGPSGAVKLIWISLLGSPGSRNLAISWNNATGESFDRRIDTVPAPADGLWHRYGLRKRLDPSDGSSYFDGYFDGAYCGTTEDYGPAANTSGGADARLWVGGVTLAGVTTSPLTASIQDLRFYDEALPASVFAEINAGTPTWEEVEDTIHEVIMEATGFASGSVIASDQNGSQPPGDYATFRLGDLGIIGAFDESRLTHNPAQASTRDLEQRTSGTREMTVSIQVFTEKTVGNGSARAILSRIQSQLALIPVREKLQTVGLSCFDHGHTQVLNFLREADFAGRASLDLRFYLRATASAFLGYIARATVTQNITQPPTTFVVQT